MAIQIRATEIFSDWLDSLKDRAGRARIQARIERLAGGNPGQHRKLKRCVSELKIDVGPGYRVYYVNRADVLVILLCGGDKATQKTISSVPTQWLATWRVDDGNKAQEL